MELNVGSLTTLYTGLKATFLEAVQQAPAPAVEALYQMVPSSTASEDYPVLGLLGDLEELLDELSYLNIWREVQNVDNIVYARGMAVKRTHMEDDQLSSYRLLVQTLGRLAVTHPQRYVPRILMQGFTTNWVDGVPVWSNSHSVGGWAFDNLDHLPLTGANFETVVRHLETRTGPAGQELDLTATHLLVGKRNKANAQRILKRQYVGGGNSNIHYEEVELLTLPNLGRTWFVADVDPVRPLVLQNRDDATLESQEDLTSDSAFDREEFRYKARRRYGIAVICPWLVQASDWGATDSATTTTTAA